MYRFQKMKGIQMKKILVTFLLVAFTASVSFNCGTSEAEKAKKDEDTLNLLFLLLILNSRSTSSTTSSGGTCFFAGTSGGCSSSTPYTCNNSSFCSSSSSCSNLSACNRDVNSTDLKSVNVDSSAVTDSVSKSEFQSSTKEKVASGASK